MGSNYDRRPVTRIAETAEACRTGWPEIVAELQAHMPSRRRVVIAIEVYPGVPLESILEELSRGLRADAVWRTEELFLPSAELWQNFETTLGEDPVFGRMSDWTVDAYFDPHKLDGARAALARCGGIALVAGTGAALVSGHADILISANLGRWELQGRQRRHLIGNLGLDNAAASPSELYKIAYFLDWRVGDKCRHAIYRQADYFLDMTEEDAPAMLGGPDLRAAVQRLVHQPFRMVPFFDPGPWGGQWMRQQFDLPAGPANYAWGFDCVPEENTVLLGFGERSFQLPAIVLVHEEPRALLGEDIVQRFGAEFPIRFDLLDTVAGGNLSLQVHPGAAYIHEHFGMPYTQDESYYILHCEPGASMMLGLDEHTEQEGMSQALYEAAAGGRPFPADDYVTAWPTAKHDHFSIPSGTVHCSGKGNVVLEVSATPYIFTFKLWDWGRTGLDGLPRPIHLEHGLANICWDRTTSWVRRELVGQTTALDQGPGWREERTGLHATQFLETRRHWFTGVVPHDTAGNLHVLNLVEGQEAVLTSPTGAFPPLVVHYAETVVVPAAAGRYQMAPVDDTPTPLATLKAFVRPRGPAAITRG